MLCCGNQRSCSLTHMITMQPGIGSMDSEIRSPEPQPSRRCLICVSPVTGRCVRGLCVTCYARVQYKIKKSSGAVSWDNYVSIGAALKREPRGQKHSVEKLNDSWRLTRKGWFKGWSS